MKKGLIHSKLFKSLFLVFFLLSLFNIFMQLNKINDLKSTKAAITAEINAENQREEELHIEQEYINSDENIEKIAREELGFIKADERIIVPNE